MALYERLMGIDRNKIPVHQFSAIIAEFARGRITGPEAQVIMDAVSGVPLDAGEKVEVTALVGTITGNATAKLARAKEIDDVLMIAERNVAPYDTVAAVETRLGV